MDTRWPIFPSLLLSTLLALGGCRSLYTPPTSPMPLHQDQGEVHLTGYRTLDGSKQGFVSATPASHLIVYGSYLQSPSVSSFYEGGTGTYVRLNDPSASSPLLLETMVGWARGSLQMTKVGTDTDSGTAILSLFLPFLAYGSEPAPYRITGTVERQSLQLTLAGIHHFEDSPISVEVGVGAQTARIAFSNLRSTGQSIADAGHLYALKPSLTNRLDFGGFGIETSGGFSVPLTTFDDRNTDVDPLRNVHVGVGIYIEPVRLFTSE